MDKQLFYPRIKMKYINVCYNTLTRRWGYGRTGRFLHLSQFYQKIEKLKDLREDAPHHYCDRLPSEQIHYHDNHQYHKIH
ncbi:MAG: hypothetical protein O4965_20520, partial [Trichodesmium sp. St19_bin1]|nr:hypothetical protein [Trichodesmium sp. St19_bin1]